MADGFQKKPLFRFSIAAMLFAMLFLGGYLGGYRVGFKTGLENGGDAQLIVVAYPVADLVTSRNAQATPNADYDSLIDQIVTTVAPDAWMENGTGEGEIQPFPSNLRLIISQTQANHGEIAALLERLRKLQTTVAASSRP